MATEKEQESELVESSQPEDSEMEASEKSAEANPLGDSNMSFGKKKLPQTGNLFKP